MESSGSSLSGIAKLKARLEALEKSHAHELGELRGSIEEFQRQLSSIERERKLPPPMPPALPVVEPSPPVEAPQPVPVPLDTPVLAASEPELEVPAEGEITEETAPTPVLAPAPAKGSMEMEIGRVWLVRIGVGLLITGLVLLGSYAYQNWIRELPAGLRLAALYLVSSGMAGGGWWLARREKMERFGEALLAGGMAFFYWCTFAAHQVDRLRVVESPVLAAVLLLGAAAGIVSVSTRRKTPLTAMMGLLMASYATTLQPIGWLAAVSNVFLAAGGMFLMRRPGWGKVGAVGMVGIYASYFWWNLAGAAGGDPQISGIGFLAATWALFALPGVVGMAGRFEESLSARGTAWFVGLNNAACFGLISLQWLLMEWDAYWRVPAVFGVVLLVLGAVSRGRNRGSSTQLSQGLAMLTLALLLKLQGYQLAVGLGMEAVALAGAFLRFRRLPELGFSIVATVGVVLATFLVPGTTTLSAGVVALFLALAIWLIRWGSGLVQDPTTRRVAETGSLVGLVGASIVAFFGWIIELDQAWQAGVAAVLGFGLCAGYLLGGGKRWLPQLREASLAFAAGAFGLMLWHGGSVPSVSASVVALGAAGAALLWEKRSGRTGVAPLAWVHALMFPAALGFAIHTWDLGSALTLILLAGAVPGMVLAFRWIACRSLVVGSSLLVLLSLLLTLDLGSNQSGFGFLTMVSAVAILVLAVYRVDVESVEKWILHGVQRTVATAAWMWAWFGLFPSGWVELIPLSTVMVWAVIRWFKLEWRLPELLVLGAISALGFVQALVVAGWNEEVIPSFSHGLGFVLSLGWVTFSLPLTRLLPTRWRRIVQGAFAISLALWMTQVGAVIGGWQPMAILWTVLGFSLVAVGLWRRMATLRHAGFALLALSFAKLFLIDVWVFGTFTRVMAFIALGVALVVLGFFYNRFASVLKRLLESEDEVSRSSPRERMVRR